MFKFSRRSLALLNGYHPKYGRMTAVHPDLRAVVELAIRYSAVDMTVLSSTLRTVEHQRDLVARGRSRTMNSRHLPQESGFVCAVDLGAYEGRNISWRPDVYFDLAEAVQRAARELNTPVEWGGCWADLNTDETVHALHARYVARKAERGRRPFFDGPHFQLPKRAYP